MKILVVDDEKDVAVLFKQRFRKEIRKGEMEFKNTLIVLSIEQLNSFFPSFDIIIFQTTLS